MVYLVGAGPGDPGLLTVKAHACLKKADTVVYDYLADSRILALVPEEAERIYVGKSAGNHAMKQEDISKLLVKLAQEGKRVVRLKGGDPFVFGRGGEEALLLAENGLPFEIVPGITSAIAVPAYAGIPVTHRGVAVSFAVVTGHEDPTKDASGLDWQKLATGIDTLVFLMGVGNLPAITAELMRHGRAGDTPAAVIRWGTRPEQETLITTVERAADDVAKAQLKPPAIFLVGEVVRCREKLRWFDAPDTRPLFGKRVLVTRARAQASKLTEGLEALGAACLEAPAICIEEPSDGGAALTRKLADGEIDIVTFTSSSTVKNLCAILGSAEPLRHAKCVAIGPITAKTCEALGIRLAAVAEEYTIEGLIETIREMTSC